MRRVVSSVDVKMNRINKGWESSGKYSRAWTQEAGKGGEEATGKWLCRWRIMQRMCSLSVPSIFYQNVPYSTELSLQNLPPSFICQFLSRAVSKLWKMFHEHLFGSDLKSYEWKNKCREKHKLCEIETMRNSKRQVARDKKQKCLSGGGLDISLSGNPFLTFLEQSGPTVSFCGIVHFFHHSHGGQNCDSLTVSLPAGR